MRVGIVEDSREDFVALQRVLGPNAIVQHWESAEQALAALDHGRIAELPIVFIDGQLPGMDGIELVEALRELPDSQDTVIVMLSGARDRRAGALARQAGADLFAYKGHTLADFKAAVGRCVALVVGGGHRAAA